MPYIPTLKICRWLYIAWNENDLHDRSAPRFGFTAERAQNRVLAALEDR